LNGFTGELEPFTYSFKTLSPIDGISEITIGDAMTLSVPSISVQLPAGVNTLIGY
jgi:hypothetical protein